MATSFTAEALDQGTDMDPASIDSNMMTDMLAEDPNMSPGRQPQVQLKQQDPWAPKIFPRAERQPSPTHGIFTGTKDPMPTYKPPALMYFQPAGVIAPNFLGEVQPLIRK